MKVTVVMDNSVSISLGSSFRAEHGFSMLTALPVPGGYQGLNKQQFFDFDRYLAK